MNVVFKGRHNRKTSTRSHKESDAIRHKCLVRLDDLSRRKVNPDSVLLHSISVSY